MSYLRRPTPRAQALSVLLALCAWTQPSSAAKIACVGDSITYGYGLTTPNSQSYPAVLQKLLGTGMHSVGNFGVSGATLLKSGDMPYWTQSNFKASDDFAPNVVVIMLGTNDAKPQNWSHKEQFASDYSALIQHYQALGATVYVAAPPPVFASGAFDIPPAALSDDVVPRVKQIAQTAAVPLIDVYAALNRKAELFPDNVHPNAEGAQLIAEAVQSALVANQFADAPSASASSAPSASASSAPSGNPTSTPSSTAPAKSSAPSGSASPANSGATSSTSGGSISSGSVTPSASASVAASAAPLATSKSSSASASSAPPPAADATTSATSLVPVPPSAQASASASSAAGSGAPQVKDDGASCTLAIGPRRPRVPPANSFAPWLWAVTGLFIYRRTVRPKTC